MATSETAAGTGPIADDWESIRYVFYLTAAWLVGTALAVLFLMTVVPSLV